MQRTLIICHEPAFPPTSGADLRNFGNAEAAAAFGPVCLVSLLPRGDEAQPAGLDIRVAQLTDMSEPRAPSLGWRRVRGESRITLPALARLKALVQDFRPDTIVVEGVALFKLLAPLRPMVRQLVLDMHNVESDLAGQLRQGKSRWPFSSGVRPLEKKAAAIADRIWVCSRADRARLEAAVRPRIPVDVVPNGIPRADRIPRSMSPRPGVSDGFPIILYIGHLGYPPNVDAAERLARVILPRVRRTLPEARLVLAGRSPGPAVLALAGLDGVGLIENPDDIEPLLSSAHLSIVPLTMGGGTRIKILEAMAWGIPVVATRLAVEGLDLTEGEEVLLSGNDEELADLATRLCCDRERMAGLRVRAYDAAWSRFGPPAIREAVRVGLGPDEGRPVTAPAARHPAKSRA